MNNNDNQNINEPELLEEESSNISSVQTGNINIPSNLTNQNPPQPQVDMSNNFQPQNQPQVNMPNNFQPQNQPQINAQNYTQQPNQNLNYNGLNNGNIPPQNFNNVNPQPMQPKKSNTGLIIAIVVIVGVVLLAIFGIIIFSSVFLTVSNVNHNVTNEIIDQQEEYNNAIEDDNLEEESLPSWTTTEFSLAGVNYKLNSSYTDLTQNGWYVDFASLGYENGYVLNPRNKTYSTISLENKNYSDADINIGFINLTEEIKDITECQYWAISVDNTYSDTPVSFSLPGGIKNGSTLEEIEQIYGKPKEEDIYRSDSLKYTEYSYEYDYTIYLDLIIYDDGGLMEFDYKKY